MSSTAIQSELLSLPASERAKLIDVLWDSLSEPEVKAREAAWAAESLSVTPGEVEEFVTGRGRPAGPPWTQEHRRAYAAGIAALAPHAREGLRLPARAGRPRSTI